MSKPTNTIRSWFGVALFGMAVLVGDRMVLVGTPGGPFLKNCVLPGTVVKVPISELDADL